MYSSIKAAIVSKLQGITGLQAVYGYEKGVLEYPAATVTLDSISTVYETNREDERKYSFKVKIYQEMEEDGVGAEVAESRIESLIDSVLDAFENDYDLGGVCHRVNINGMAGYVDRGTNHRVLEFTIDCYKLYSLS
jgi:hypothetical protein